jgi:hypothetical protein
MMEGLANPTRDAKRELAILGITLDQIDPTARSFAEIMQTLHDANLSVSSSFKIFGSVSGANIASIAAKWDESQAKATGYASTLDKLRTMIKHYGGDPAALVAVKPLDVFHMELWGCIDAYRAPSSQPSACQSLKSSSESEEPALPEEPEEQEEEAVAVYNDRTLATKFEEVAAVRPTVLGSRPATITEVDAKRQLDSDLADLTADEKRHLTILYRPEMLRATAEHIAEEIARLPPKETIHWMTCRPEPLVVYKHMSLQRKLDWLLHRARDAELEHLLVAYPGILVGVDERCSNYGLRNA